MLYLPFPSIVFSNQSSTSFITSEWKAAYDVVKYLQAFLWTSILVEEGGPVGAIIGAGFASVNLWKLSEMQYRSQQQLNSTWEESGPPTYRKYHMNIFKTTKDQVPLSEPVRSISNGFFLRMLPSASQRCGSMNLTLQGRLWLPFFYKNPPPNAPNEYGEWLPVDIWLFIVVPVFVKS
jgi:hypothetical protein